MEYCKALEWIYSTQHFGIKLGLEAPTELLKQFLAFPAKGTKVMHIAGTNGKGSTCALIDSIARAHGVRTGLFTSPHLVDFRERFRVNGEMISEKETARYLKELRNLVSEWKNHPTFFELALALGMKFFGEKEVELIVLETGMGGRLDATTAVPSDVNVLTPVAMDHAQWLGDTLEKIASEKAGIIVSDAPVVSAKQEAEAARVIAQQANQMRAPLKIVSGALAYYNVALPGEHQRENAAVALEALNQLGLDMRYDSVKAGLEEVKWAGRFEVISRDPLVVLDGAHNPHAAEILVKTWREQYGELQPLVIFGAIESKDLEGVLANISSIAQQIIFTPIDSPRSLPYQDVLDTLEKNSAKPISSNNLAHALEIAQKSGLPILVTGSLYLLGEYYAHITKKEHTPTSQ